MGVHYPRNLIGRIRAAKLVPVTIAIGGDICWQGGVSVSEQLGLLATLQSFEAAHPLAQLPDAPSRYDEEDDTPLLPRDQATTAKATTAQAKPTAQATTAQAKPTAQATTAAKSK